MFDLYAKQIEGVSSGIKERAQKESGDYLLQVRSASVDTVFVRNPGKFIGRGGSNLRSLQRQTSTTVYGRGVRSEQMFVVYYRDASGLAAVKRAAARY
jgi:hypothetical protein